MAFVLDTSVALSWCLPDEFSPTTHDIYTGLTAGYAVLPMLWNYELANVLALAERKNRITQVQIARFLSALHAFDLRFVQADPMRLIELSRQTGLTAYDAAYLDSSLATGLPLATLDRKLRATAVQHGITVLPA